MQTVKKQISELKPHPRNEEIYGVNEDISDLKEKIRKSGLVTTLTITENDVILSGNRRWKSCKQLVQEGDKRFCTLTCEVRNFDSEEDELEYLVICNDTREKTMEQKAREAQMLIEIEKIRARKRQATSTGGDKPQLVPFLAQAEKGKTRDVVAKKLRMKSGHEVDRAVKSVETIDKLTEIGRKDDADLIRTTLNNASASTAADLSLHIDELTEAEKQAIRDKKMSAYKVVSKYATKRTPKITEDMTEEQKAEIAHEQACKEAVDEYIAQSMGLIDPQSVSTEDRLDELIAFFNCAVNTFTTAANNLACKAVKFTAEQKYTISEIITKAESNIALLKNIMED